MFKKGDKIVYPMYGAGIIENIEDSGEGEKYYNITLPNGNLKIRLSSKKADTIGLRMVSEQDEILEVMDNVSKSNIISSDNWNQRYKENLEKIRTGRLEAVAEVVRNLNSREKLRNLSGAEKKMLNNARQIILSEISLSNDIVKEKAEELLAKTLLN